MAHRPKPKAVEHEGLVFVTQRGGCWNKEIADCPIAKEMRQLLITQGAHRRGLGFYGLRHSFETIAGESQDPVAVDHIMGHADESMAAVYRERISDERLLAVTDRAHRWLFGEESSGS